MKTPFHNPRLLFLAIATFAVGTDAYVIAEILPEIAQDLRWPTRWDRRFLPFSPRVLLAAGY